MKVNILAKICFPFSKNCGKRLQELRNCRPSFLLRPHRQKQNTWPKLGILERWSDQHAHRPPWSELINSFHRMVPRFATAGSLQRLMIFFFNASFRSPSPPHPPFRLLYNWDGSFSACRVLPRLSWCLPLFTCYRWLSKNRFATPDVKKKNQSKWLVVNEFDHFVSLLVVRSKEVLHLILLAFHLIIFPPLLAHTSSIDPVSSGLNWDDKIVDSSENLSVLVSQDLD